MILYLPQRPKDDISSMPKVLLYTSYRRPLGSNNYLHLFLVGLAPSRSGHVARKDHARRIVFGRPGSRGRVPALGALHGLSLGCASARTCSLARARRPLARSSFRSGGAPPSVEARACSLLVHACTASLSYDPIQMVRLTVHGRALEMLLASCIPATQRS